MPRYYFDVQDGRYVHDVDGIDLPDSTSAEREALRVLLDVAVDRVREQSSISNQSPIMVMMRKGSGVTAFKATLSVAIDRPKLS